MIRHLGTASVETKGLTYPPEEQGYSGGAQF